MISPQYHLPKLQDRQGPDSGIYAMLRQAMLNNCKDKGKKQEELPAAESLAGRRYLVCLTEEEFMKRMWDVEV